MLNAILISSRSLFSFKTCLVAKPAWFSQNISRSLNIPAIPLGFNERNFSNFPEGIKISGPLQILLCGRFRSKRSGQNFCLNFIWWRERTTERTNLFWTKLGVNSAIAEECTCPRGGGGAQDRRCKFCSTTFDIQQEC